MGKGDIVLETLGRKVKLHVDRFGLKVVPALLYSNPYVIKFLVRIVCLFAPDVLRTFPADITIARKLIYQGANVIEIGSNKGALTKWIARQVGDKGVVIAIEPNPVSFQFLLYVTRGFKNVVCVNCGLDERAGNALLYVPRGPTDQSATMVKNASNAQIKFNSVIMTLDNLVKLLNVAPDIIVIDCEGCELKAMRGGAFTLQSFRPKLFIEIHPDLVDKIDEQLISFLSNFGYCIINEDRQNNLLVFESKGRHKT